MLIFSCLAHLKLIFRNTNHKAERSETMLEHSDDNPLERIKCVKRGGVVNIKRPKVVFLTLFGCSFLQWDILYLAKLGNNVKSLGQITPLLSFLFLKDWHARCFIYYIRKGRLCHCKPNHLLTKKTFPFHLNFQREAACQLGWS